MKVRNLASRSAAVSATLILFSWISPTAALAQTPGRYPQRTDIIRFCSAQDSQCRAPGTFYPGMNTTPPTLDSVRRDAAIAQWQQTQDTQYVRPEPQAEYQYERPPRATPDAPDQSELLKNSKDPDFIKRNFKTMYVETRNIEYFKAAQMVAALRRNPDFSKLNITIVGDPRVADVRLVVSYTFAWDYPFVLMHQNTTSVLWAGKGEGPFSGPLGAADVAREFVKLAKPWRTAENKGK